MFNFLIKIFCKHEFIDCCRINDFHGSTMDYQKRCLSRTTNGHCKRHNENNEILYGYCDYYYQKCHKCGEIKK